LRAVAGLEPATGRLSVAGSVWQDGVRSIPAHQRPLGYVFQEPSLFPHLNVADNLRYGERRTPRGEQRTDFAAVVALLGLEGLLERRPEALSGGERQRVAIGRALLRSPRLLLMDEPLAALDQPRKRELLNYLQAVQRQLRLPVLYVSHVVEEVAQLADQLVLLDAGATVAAGPVADMLTRLDLPLATDVDASAVISGVVQDYDSADQLNTISFGGGLLLLASPTALDAGPVKVRVLARDVSLTLLQQQATSILNIVPAVVSGLQATAAGQCTVQLDCGGARLLARVSQRSVRTLGLRPGSAVYAQIKAAALLTR
jgi:molybdate transport system ATP-binding protein